ncbi:hypothetical protein DXG01_004742 [Tephrocybe rancida]|nr:hypothetical protein DXG01_004742 [Tephrocybe rancida]
MSVGSVLYFLSSHYNEGREWADPTVWVPFVLFIVFLVLFLLVEAYLAYEPVLPTSLLWQRAPFLIGCSNAFVAVCNLSVTYFFPVWFQTVMLSSASTAAAILLRQMREDSSQAHLWLSICCTRVLKTVVQMPLGFGNAVVLQTMYSMSRFPAIFSANSEKTLVALVASLPADQLAVGTGFTQLLRGLGQVGGLAAASAVFQSRLDSELRARIHTPGAEETIKHIRQSARLIGELPPGLQRIARDAYAASLNSVFTLAIPDADLGDNHSPAAIRNNSHSGHEGKAGRR